MEHQRIDEGIKRGPRVDLTLPTTTLPANANSGKLADLDDQHTIERIANGERVTEIALGLGVDPSALYHRYEDNALYQAAKVIGTAVRLDQAEHGLEVAPDALSLARAREVWRSRQWRASVEHSDKWGQKQEVSVSVTVDLGAKLRRFRERVIEHESVAVAQPVVDGAALLPILDVAAVDLSKQLIDK